jgi:integrase
MPIARFVRGLAADKFRPENRWDRVRIFAPGDATSNAMGLTPAAPSLAIVRSILDRCEDNTMPGQRYQDPPIEERRDVKRPFYYIRPYIPVVTEQGLERKRTSIQLGFINEMSKRQAKAAKEHIMATVNSGKFLVQSQLLFSSVLEKYEAIAIPDLGPEAQLTYKRHIRLHVRPTFEKLRMCDIDRIAVKAWLNERQEQGYSHNTLIDLRKVLSAIFSKAAEWRLWQGENPCSKQKVGGPRGIMDKRLPSAEGLVRFLGEIRESKIISADGARLVALTSIATGMRVGEALGLQVRDIDRSWGRGHEKPTKTEDSKRVRQAPGVATELVRYGRGKADTAFIFGRSDCHGQPPDDRDLQQHVFRPAAERAGIYTEGFGMHRFRHLNISWRQEVGAGVFEAQKAAGHSQPSTTWLYTQTDVERERDHVQKIMNRLTGYAVGTAAIQ